MNFWDKFPAKEELENTVVSESDKSTPDVNAHMHTPFSFSAFDSIPQAVEMAAKEGVQVVGINDFYTTRGYDEWAENCLKFGLFPLFNVEFVGLSPDDQKNNIRINDPGNPGRIYLSGKGLSYPFKLARPYDEQMATVMQKANEQVQEMCAKLNAHLQISYPIISLSFDDILQNETKGLIRERHLAKALRKKVYELASDNKERKEMLEKIFSGKELKSDTENVAAVENEIRGALLKAGGPAFVPEDPDSFLNLEAIKQVIVQGGGIPTYPLLADSVNGGFTEYEEDKEILLKDLKQKGIYSVEFITNRNSTKVLEDYADFFLSNGIAVSFGSEHNTPELMPIKLFTAKGEDLSPRLKKMNYKGACIIAAHQYLFARYAQGFLNKEGTPVTSDLDSFAELGDKLIRFYKSKIVKANA